MLWINPWPGPQSRDPLGGLKLGRLAGNILEIS